MSLKWKMKLIKSKLFIRYVLAALTMVVISACGIKGVPLAPLEPVVLKSRDENLKEQTEKSLHKKSKKDKSGNKTNEVVPEVHE